LYIYQEIFQLLFISIFFYRFVALSHESKQRYFRFVFSFLRRFMVSGVPPGVPQRNKKTPPPPLYLPRNPSPNGLENLARMDGKNETEVGFDGLTDAVGSVLPSIFVKNGQ
jgi:hypothetical protein